MFVLSVCLATGNSLTSQSLSTLVRCQQLWEQYVLVFGYEWLWTITMRARAPISFAIRQTHIIITTISVARHRLAGRCRRQKLCAHNILVLHVLRADCRQVRPYCQPLNCFCNVSSTWYSIPDGAQPASQPIDRTSKWFISYNYNLIRFAHRKPIKCVQVPGASVIFVSPHGHRWSRTSHLHKVHAWYSIPIDFQHFPSQTHEPYLDGEM